MTLWKKTKKIDNAWAIWNAVLNKTRNCGLSSNLMLSEMRVLTFLVCFYFVVLGLFFGLFC